MPPKSKAVSQNVKLDDLILDINNPRFAELYSGSRNEDDLIEYLLYTEAAEEVASAIVKAGEFYPDRPLWVVKQQGKYLVKDGNRRCSAVKALQLPGKYKLGFPKTTFRELPVLIYDNQTDIDERIVEEHAGNLFRRWERIAKALEVLKLTENGRWEEVRELDSKPGDLIKLASFYKEAVKYGGDDLRLLLRRGRGKTGGKTIIFERLFRNAALCGYNFNGAPTYLVNIVDANRFAEYVKALVRYLKAEGEITTTETVDNDKMFLERLEPYGFFAYQPAAPDNASSTSATNSNIPDPLTSIPDSDTSTPSTQPIKTPASAPKVSAVSSATKKGSVKKSPTLLRKGMPAGLKSRIAEYFSIDANAEPNAKTAMARVTFECVLKYVVENTKFNTRTVMSKSSHFQLAYRRPPYTDFTNLKAKFTELIKNTGDNKAFNAFDLDSMHTIVHNYKVNAVSHNAEQISFNLIVLIEFMLQDENDLLSSLDLTKL